MGDAILLNKKKTLLRGVRISLRHFQAPYGLKYSLYV